MIFSCKVTPQFIKSLSQVAEEGHRARAVWSWTSQTPPNPTSECQICSVSVKFVLLVAHLMSAESQMQSSQIGAQTSVLFVSMFQVSGSLTSSLACGWNCPSISFHKKKSQTWSHHTDHHTSHSLLFPQRFRDSETQRQWQRVRLIIFWGFCDFCEDLSEFLSAFVSRLGFCIWLTMTNRRRE